MKNTIWLLVLFLFTSSMISAQSLPDETEKKLILSGSVQSDVLIPQEDANIGSPKYDDKLLTNTFVDFNLNSKYVDAGLRFEYLQHPLPGFEQGYKGYGVPYFYIKGKLKNLDLTLGTFYEQFGSGFILRTYEERSLGIDNSLLGGRLVYRPTEGITLKAVSGEQRHYWAHNNSWITGLDLELNLDTWIKALRKKGTHVLLGTSFVNKYEHPDNDNIMVDRTHKLNLPKFVNGWEARLQVQTKGVNIFAEYAFKTDDPSFANGYIYRHGNVAMLSASYSRQGMSFLVQAKRSSDMVFLSRRNSVGISSYINHLPPFTQDHTYALAALYPYATRPDGEWAYQAQLGYKFPKRTLLGGKYGMNLKLNFSHVHAIDHHVNTSLSPDHLSSLGTKGYGASFFRWGDATYYQDLNIQAERKFSKRFKMSLMYMNQFYNKTIVEGEGGTIHSDILIADAKYTFSPKVNLRSEVQYLATKNDEGDWWFGLLELSLVPHFMFTISDMYNAGSSHLHYYQVFITFNKGAHRLQIGYGRTRAGFNCSGGVCRYIPASRGFTLSYNFNF